MHVARQEEEEEEEDLEEEEPDAVWKGERAKGCSSACLLTGRLLGPRRVLPRAFLRDGGREDEQESRGRKNLWTERAIALTRSGLVLHG